MQPARAKRPPKTVLRLQNGNYFVRTIRREDASDRWADWLADPATIEVLNAAPQSLQKGDIAEYIKQFDQRSRLLLGIFDRRTHAHIGIIRLDIDHAAREAVVNAFIGEPDYRNKGATMQVFVPLLDYLFDKLGLRMVRASILERNQVTIRYLLRLGWRVDQGAETPVKSISDGAMLGTRSLSLTPDAWRAFRATHTAKRIIQRIGRTERALAHGPAGRSKTPSVDP
jgi:RimJ/RimL family protein N-acetyltransferase